MRQRSLHEYGSEGVEALLIHPNMLHVSQECCCSHQSMRALICLIMHTHGTRVEPSSTAQTSATRVALREVRNGQSVPNPRRQQASDCLLEMLFHAKISVAALSRAASASSPEVHLVCGVPNGSDLPSYRVVALRPALSALQSYHICCDGAAAAVSCYIHEPWRWHSWTRSQLGPAGARAYLLHPAPLARSEPAAGQSQLFLTELSLLHYCIRHSRSNAVLRCVESA